MCGLFLQRGRGSDEARYPRNVGGTGLNIHLFYVGVTGLIIH